MYFIDDPLDITVSVNLSTDYENKSQEAFQEGLTSWKQVSIGALPNENNDPSEWAQTVHKSPMPIKGSFINWKGFLKKYNLGNTAFTDEQLKELSDLIEEGMKTYCSGFLKVKGIVQSCGDSHMINYDEKYNVPGGKIFPGVDYTKLGGFSGYKWESLNKKCEDVAVDSTGYIYCVQSNNEVHRYEMKKESWSKIGFIHGQNIDAEQGILIVRGTDNQTWVKNFNTNPNQEEDWAKVGSANAKDVCIDENGQMLIADDDNNVCMYRDYVDKRQCKYYKSFFVTCANGSLYTYGDSKEKDEVLNYSKTDFDTSSKILTKDTEYKDGCITKAGWGYKILKTDGDDKENDGNIYYMENIIDYANTGSVKISGKAKRIACASTNTGPIVVHVGTEGTYLRVADI